MGSNSLPSLLPLRAALASLPVSTEKHEGIDLPPSRNRDLLCHLSYLPVYFSPPAFLSLVFSSFSPGLYSIYSIRLLH